MSLSVKEHFFLQGDLFSGGIFFRKLYDRLCSICIYVNSPHQKALRHSRLIIRALDNLAVMGNQTPNFKWQSQPNDNYAPSSGHPL